MRFHPSLCVSVLALFAVLLDAPAALAHGLGVECRLRGDRVEVEAFYDDNTPARHAKVSVLSADGKSVIGPGRTDVQGRWSFDKPSAGKYVVVVNDGGGHLAKAAISVPAGPADPALHPSLRISEGPNREEFTAFPWLKMAIGFGAIAGLALLFVLIQRSRTTTPPQPVASKEEGNGPRASR